MGSKVLIVDDDPDVIKLIADNLAVRGFEVIVAGNGKEAIEKFRIQHPDLVILDLMMPEVDGYDVCNQIKSDPLTGHIPIIMLTARDEQESHITVSTGRLADLYLTKPFDIMELEKRVMELIKGAGGGA